MSCIASSGRSSIDGGRQQEEDDTAGHSILLLLLAASKLQWICGGLVWEKFLPGTSEEE